MHYYQFHIGDYLSATSHLSNDEDLAYRRLLDMYYDTEKPIPIDIQWVSRRLRLGSEIIQSVLNDMFEYTEFGYKNSRADEEIRAYHSYLEKQKANGKLGGRPARSQTKPTANPSLTQAEPKITLTTNHKPITNNHISIDQFETFWKVYPKKTAKENAKKAWIKIKPNDELIAKITKAVKDQKLSEREQQFIPHAATWLNAKRWEDEIAGATQKPLMGWK
jgi:uncharacterized protein YdaU (DUF1376 family)